MSSLCIKSQRYSGSAGEWLVVFATRKVGLADHPVLFSLHSSDSRIPETLITDSKPGTIFVHVSSLT